MNAHQPISLRDRLNAEDKARKRRLGFTGKPQPLEPKIAPVGLYGSYRQAKPEWRTKPVYFEEHINAWREWNVRLNKFFGSPLRTYIMQRSGELGQTYEDVVGTSRTREIAYARQIIMWEIKQWVKPDASYPEIGRLFGGKDHTTVLHAIRKINAIKAKGGLVTHDMASIFPTRSPRRAQNVVLELIRRSFQEKKRPPTPEEISRSMGWGCTMTAYNMLKRLEDDGKIIRPTCSTKDIRLA